MYQLQEYDVPVSLWCQTEMPHSILIMMLENVIKNQNFQDIISGCTQDIIIFYHFINMEIRG